VNLVVTAYLELPGHAADEVLVVGHDDDGAPEAHHRVGERLHLIMSKAAGGRGRGVMGSLRGAAGMGVGVEAHGHHEVGAACLVSGALL
jgi:hypothetical protein